MQHLLEYTERLDNMSRVFRRPMFRGGSTNMNGIMSGIEDRENFQNGTTAERLQKIAEQSASQSAVQLGAATTQTGQVIGLEEQ